METERDLDNVVSDCLRSPLSKVKNRTINECTRRDIANRPPSQFIGPGFDLRDAIKLILRDANNCLT